MVLFETGGHRIAIPVDVVREIVPARPYTALPGSAPYVLGLVNLRGRIVTVIDLGVRLRLRPAADRVDHSIVVVEHAGKTVGIAVEDLARMAEVDADALDDSAQTLQGLGAMRAYLRGVGETDGQLFVAVDVDEILRPILA